MSRKVKIILNPIADMGNAWRVARDLRPITLEYGNVDWSGTVYPGHAIELAKQAGEQGYDMVIAIGGDGTVHEVVNGLMRLPENKRPLLGIVPVGSGNDFAHANNIPRKSDHALAYALTGEASSIDLGLMTDEHGRKEYFDNTLGIGFDAIVTIRSHKLPILRGFLIYLTAVIQTILLDHNPALAQFETDSEKWEDQVLMTTICNGGREGGGFMLSPDSKMTDGVLEYLTVRKVSRPMMFRLVPEFMNGTHRRFTKHIRMGVCKKLTMTSDRPLYIHADGEIFTSFGSNLRKVSFEVLPNALKVVRG
ncbi:MAG: diacylglycerol kinase family lipid kinase [Anaerolineales bacterium]|nr:diacylglycerol kinase family lipid kinase [Anaerolineales bacterium]